MSKLREKFIPYTLENPLDVSRSGEANAIICEQITDDFSVKLLIWCVKLKNGQLGDKIDFTKSDEEIAQELQQYFKENIYGKE